MGRKQVSVVIVDDSPQMLTFLRMLFEDDARFELVGEGSDGEQAVELATTLQPDLIVLDRQMPKLGGVEAIPEIHERSPKTSVILFTTNTDDRTYHAALSAGAVDVVEKRLDLDVVDHLVDRLVDRINSPEAEVEIALGPVPSAAARAWVRNSRAIVAAVVAHPEVVGRAIPSDVLAVFERFMAAWDDIARNTEEFTWRARAKVTDVQRIVDNWAAINEMTDEQLQRLGVQWSTEEGREFFNALAAAVFDAMDQHAATQELAAILRPRWEL